MDELLEGDLAVAVRVQVGDELRRAQVAVAVAVNDAHEVRVLQQLFQRVRVEAEVELGLVEVQVGRGRVEAQLPVRLVGGHEQLAQLLPHGVGQRVGGRAAETGQVLGVAPVVCRQPADLLRARVGLQHAKHFNSMYVALSSQGSLITRGWRPTRKAA